MAVLSLKNVRYPIKIFLADMWQYIAGYRRRLMFWYIIFMFSSSLSLLSPVIVAKIIDNIIKSNFTIIPYLIVAFFTIELSRLVGRNRIKLQVYKLAEHCRLASRQRWISQVIDFDLKWHDTQNSGKKISIISRSSEQLTKLLQFVTKGDGGIEIFVGIVGIIIIFLTINPKYALICLVNITFYLTTLYFQTKQLNYTRHKINQATDKIVGKNFDFFSNMALIKSLGIGQSVNRVLFEKESKLKDKAIDYHNREFNKWVYINTVSITSYTVALYFITSDIISGAISVGSFVIYSNYINKLRDSLGSLTEWLNDLIEYYLGFFRLRQLLQSGTISTNIGTKLFPKNLSNINFNNLNFSYNPTNKILNNINLKLVAGNKYGFVGASGSGKTTLGKLLLRLYLPQKGTITLNQTPLNHIETSSLHQNIGVTPQENEIFNLSFKDNVIIAANTSRFDQKLYDLAIKTAECQPILDKIKNNHQTMLGEKGIKLSGGEKQRLGIARVIYKNTPIIIFDESTSALDSKTESKILTNLEKYFADKTIIWIAHRLSTLRFTDQIIVFDDGHIAEQDNFHALIDKKGIFFDLWQIQKKTNLG